MNKMHNYYTLQSMLMFEQITQGNKFALTFGIPTIHCSCEPNVLSYIYILFLMIKYHGKSHTDIRNNNCWIYS